MLEEMLSKEKTIELLNAPNSINSNQYSTLIEAWPNDEEIWPRLILKNDKIYFISYLLENKIGLKEDKINSGLFDPEFVCRHFTRKMYYRFSNFEHSKTEFESDVGAYEIKKIDKKFRIPMREAYIRWDGRCGHAINAVLLDSDEADENNWFLIEPQTKSKFFYLDDIGAKLYICRDHEMPLNEKCESAISVKTFFINKNGKIIAENNRYHVLGFLTTFIYEGRYYELLQTLFNKSVANDFDENLLMEAVKDSENFSDHQIKDMIDLIQVKKTKERLIESYDDFGKRYRKVKKVIMEGNIRYSVYFDLKELFMLDFFRNRHYSDFHFPHFTSKSSCQLELICIEEIFDTMKRAAILSVEEQNMFKGLLSKTCV